MTRGSVTALAALGVFVALLLYLVVSSLAPREVATFDPDPNRVPAAAEAFRVDTATVRATHEEEWKFFELRRGVELIPPDTSGWDLAFRRFNIISSGGMADLGPVSFDEVNRVPAVEFASGTSGGDSANPVIARWYDYGMFSHLLTPKGHVYLIHTRDDRYAKLELLSYYCTGVEPGCVTFRFGYQPLAGSLELDSVSP